MALEEAELNIAAVVSTIAMVWLIGCDDRRATRSNVATADSLNSPTVVLVGRNLADNLLAYMDRLEELDTATTETLRRRLPVHVRMLTELLAQYDREMTILDVKGGHRWQATVDSVRSDLSILQQANDRELRPALKAHQRRVGKLITHHETMLRARGDLNQPPSGGAPVERPRPD